MAARAQGNLSGVGLGYPEGELSTTALAMGGGVAEFDALSPINPAALGGLNTVTLHMQYDPEYRIVSAGGTSKYSVTSRFPVIDVTVPINSRITLGLSAASFLDRTWSTSTNGPAQVGDTTVQSTATFLSDGGITDVRLAAGWQPTSWLRVGLGLHELTGEDRITVTRIFGDTAMVKTATFNQFTDYGFNGVAASVGFELQPVPALGVAASYRAGGTLRARLGDTLTDKASVPPRAGAAIRFNGVPGLTVAARADWEGWSRLNGFGPSVGARDALEIGGGIDLAGPHLSAKRPLFLRLGARERDLPFLAEGAVVHETDVSGGVGIPVAGPHALIDVTLQHATRTAPIDVGETAWTASIGFTIRP
jgi:hypothetical protein